MAMTTPTSYRWLCEYIGDDAPSSDKVAELLGAHAFEIEEVRTVGDDTVIDVDILPNRSSDCLCHRGIAREVATLTGKALQNDPLQKTPSLTPTDVIAVNISVPEACPRFTASLIKGVTIKESPQWLKDRLEAIGQRPINNIVDATNYVMFSIGQPIHAYDADLFPQVNGKWQFGVRYAEEGEVVSLIAEGGKDEERNVELKGTELLIIDESSNTPIGLAGVKGGRFAGVHADTENVIIEAAHFHPTITRKTARRLGIVIDASKRFENEPSRELPPYAQSEIVKLIVDIAGGTYEGTLDEYLERKENQAVAVSVDRVNALLGVSLEKVKMQDILERIGCSVEVTETGFLATGPWERTDLSIEEDFIEEIGRVYGYEHVAAVVPEAVMLSEFNTRHYYCDKIRGALVESGYSEVITSSFRKKDKVQLQNALASDKTCLRSSLSKNIYEALDKNSANTDVLGNPDTRLFEIGTVFYEGEGTIAEHTALAAGVRLRPSGYSGKEDKILNEVLKEIEQTLGVQIDWQIEKGVAETNLTTLLEKLPKPTGYDEVPSAPEIVYKPFSHYPAISRDISLWVTEGTKAEEIETVLNEKSGELRVRTTLFDEFTKDGQTSFAFRLVFQSYEKTLTDEEVNNIMDAVYAAVSERGWEVR